MSIRLLRAGLPGLAIALVPLTTSHGHEIVGNRFFPATLGIDDPGVNDELALPTVDSFKTGDIPPVRQRDISGEFSKRITEDFAISFGSTYTFLGPIDPTAAGANGFQNLETTFKYRVFKDPVHEFVMSVGLSVEWGGTGSANVGAESFNVYTPTIYFGKGLGDLPDTLSWIRPVAITGQVGYAIPGKSATTTFGIDPDTGDQTIDTEFNPRVLNWGGSIQYSMPYLKSAVVDLSLPDFINRLIPLVEANLQTPVANTLTSGTTTSVDPDQPAERQQRRGDRPIALLSRRHRSARHRQTHLRRARSTSQPLSKELNMQRSSLIGIVPLLLLLVTGQATAHAMLDHAEPRVGNKVATPPGQVTLWFTQKLEQAFSTITVTNAAGQRVDSGKTRVSGSQMSVSLRPGGNGAYRVNWHVLSVDTHTTDGSFTFQVGE